MKNNYLANQIKTLRVAKGYSQDHLAGQTNLSLRTIQRIEGGQTEPHGDTLQRLAGCLGVAVADLLNNQTTFSTEDAPPPALPQDKSYLITIHLSALSFFIFPFLGAVVPDVLWTVKRNQIDGINETAKRVINFQLTWCIIMVIYYVLMFTGGDGGIISVMVIIPLYAYNVLMIVMNTILAFYNKRQFYQPALRLLR